jgi:hypothetical protein
MMTRRVDRLGRRPCPANSSGEDAGQWTGEAVDNGTTFVSPREKTDGEGACYASKEILQAIRILWGIGGARKSDRASDGWGKTMDQRHNQKVDLRLGVRLSRTGWGPSAPKRYLNSLSCTTGLDFLRFSSFSSASSSSSYWALAPGIGGR